MPSVFMALGSWELWITPGQKKPLPASLKHDPAYLPSHPTLPLPPLQPPWAPPSSCAPHHLLFFLAPLLLQIPPTFPGPECPPLIPHASSLVSSRKSSNQIADPSLVLLGPSLLPLVILQQINY